MEHYDRKKIGKWWLCYGRNYNWAFSAGVDRYNITLEFYKWYIMVEFW